MKALKQIGLWLIIIASIVGLPALAQHASAAPARTAASATACTQHHNYESSVNFSDTNSVVVYSNASWSRSVYYWDTCSGGVKFVFSFDTDCHLRTRQWGMNTAGDTTTYYGVVGDRGSTCNARPGRAQWQTNGSFATWSNAGTKLSYTPYTSASPFLWQILFDGCRERIMNWWTGHGYLDFWFGPTWSSC